MNRGGTTKAASTSFTNPLATSVRVESSFLLANVVNPGPSRPNLKRKLQADSLEEPRSLKKAKPINHLELFFAGYSRLSALQLRPPRTRLRPVRRAPSALRLLQTEQEAACAGYQRAMVLSFGANYGTDVNDLGCLQSLAKVLQADPILERVRAIHVANVNLVDLILDWGTSEGRSPLPTIFGTPNGLRVYTQTTRKLVWTPSMGDPRAPGTSDAGNTWTEKLKGNYELPFSIKIPEFAESPDGEERFRLPHTFTDRASRGSIQYYLELRISRGKLRSDDRSRWLAGLGAGTGQGEIIWRPRSECEMHGFFFQNRFVGLPTVPVYTVVRLRLYGYRNRNRIDTSKDLYRTRLRLRNELRLSSVKSLMLRKVIQRSQFVMNWSPGLIILPGASGRYQQSLRESFNRASEKSAHCRVPGIEQNLNDCLLSG
ncbi:hypothetical protein B0H14DRAFT_3751530 [Mycena olivaceomarginata]|nr:hypothetical protein B0H14DRAFT_3751530 [Mycena olivaceomarginata]